MPQLTNNNSNETTTQINNSTTVTESSPTDIAQSNAHIDYKKQKIEKLSKIRKEVKEEKLSVKQAIEKLKYEKLKYVDLSEIEDEDEHIAASEQISAQTKKSKETPAQQPTQQTSSPYITKVNGSVIIRIG